MNLCSTCIVTYSFPNYIHNNHMSYIKIRGSDSNSFHWLLKICHRTPVSTLSVSMHFFYLSDFLWHVCLILLIILVESPSSSESWSWFHQFPCSPFTDVLFWINVYKFHYRFIKLFHSSFAFPISDVNVFWSYVSFITI